MTPQELLAAYRTRTAAPRRSAIAARFAFALATSKDVHSAMAAVNEMLERPLTYEEFLARAA